MPEATYTIGLPVHPPILWDNGFTVAKHAPTAKDYALLAEWVAVLNAGEAGQKVPLLPHHDLSDALAAYRHYLYGEGKDRTFSYERSVNPILHCQASDGMLTAWDSRHKKRGHSGGDVAFQTAGQWAERGRFLSGSRWR